MVDIIEIYVHWYAGRSKSTVATSLGIDRKTLRNYLRPAERAGIVPGRSADESGGLVEADQELVSGVG